MSLIKGKGAPGRFTKGSVGDKYIDLDTGNEYLCTFSFGDSNGASKEYSWKLISTGAKDNRPNPVAPEIKMEKIPESNFQETKPEQVEEVKDSEPVEEQKVEEPVKESENQNRPNRNNYSKHYKPKNN